MCGIWGLVSLNKQEINEKIIQNFYRITHRGPDNSILQKYRNVWIGFHRLSIIDTSMFSNQPFIFQKGENTIVFVCNGEIYNYKELIKMYDLKNTNSDCMTIPLLYLKYDYTTFTELFNKSIKGEYAFMIYEFNKFNNLTHIVVGRDTIGIRPLYYHPPTINSTMLMFSSEIKGMNDFPDYVDEFMPGVIQRFNFDSFGNYNNVNSYDFKNYLSIQPTLPYKSVEYYLLRVREAVICSVMRRLQSDQPIVFLVSGGVDSSIVAGSAAKLLGTPIRTFCCGMSEGTDLIYARKVAKHIGSTHTEVMFTPQEGLAVIDDVIYTIESWDTTSIRASVPQYMVCRDVGTKTDAKAVMIGEGADEVCSSYLFNWYAPNGDKLHNAAKEYVGENHCYDVRRADRCISRWGLEGRASLYDTEFIEAYWSIPAEYRMPTYKGIEKWWLRKAFDGTNIIPDEVLWRKKEAFSDGVSSKEKSWFEIIQEYIETLISDEEFANASKLYTYNTPTTKEAYYYRKVFCKLFGENRQTIIPHYWQPKWNKDGKEITEYIDPSARVLKIYSD
jgi:asparagine synthase (glutamine-hydrolysing)